MAGNAQDEEQGLNKDLTEGTVGITVETNPIGMPDGSVRTGIGGTYTNQFDGNRITAMGGFDVGNTNVQSNIEDGTTKTTLGVNAGVTYDRKLTKNIAIGGGVNLSTQMYAQESTLDYVNDKGGPAEADYNAYVYQENKEIYARNEAKSAYSETVFGELYATTNSGNLTGTAKIGSVFSQGFGEHKSTEVTHFAGLSVNTNVAKLGKNAKMYVAGGANINLGQFKNSSAQIGFGVKF